MSIGWPGFEVLNKTKSKNGKTIAPYSFLAAAILQDFSIAPKGIESFSPNQGLDQEGWVAHHMHSTALTCFRPGSQVKPYWTIKRLMEGFTGAQLGSGSTMLLPAKCH
jgi:hypothetical protein